MPTMTPLERITIGDEQAVVLERRGGTIICFRPTNDVYPFFVVSGHVRGAGEQKCPVTHCSHRADAWAIYDHLVAAL